MQPPQQEASDPFLALHHDLQERQQKWNVPTRRTDGGVNTVMAQGGLLNDIPLPGDDTDTDDENPSAICRSKRQKKQYPL
ncbi:hypothetical protein G9A89_000486 [Geosiphon pyriformis]|nr:hypothetical protein G9A89_000486 [Geosiphon pyriformis]